MIKEAECTPMRRKTAVDMVEHWLAAPETFFIGDVDPEWLLRAYLGMRDERDAARKTSIEIMSKEEVAK